MSDNKKYYCSWGCGKEVKKYGERCQSCEPKFDDACERYITMKKSIRDKSFEKRRDAINKFRCGG